MDHKLSNFQNIHIPPWFITDDLGICDTWNNQDVVYVTFFSRIGLNSYKQCVYTARNFQLTRQINFITRLIYDAGCL